MRAKKVNIQFSGLFEDQIAVVSGLENIENVVTEGAPYLVDQSLVEIINE